MRHRRPTSQAGRHDRDDRRHQRGRDGVLQAASEDVRHPNLLPITERECSSRLFLIKVVDQSAQFLALPIRERTAAHQRRQQRRQ